MSTYPPIRLQEAGIYNHEDAYIWWRTPNFNLNGKRPVDMWLDNNTGERDLVRDEMSRLTDGIPQ